MDDVLQMLYLELCEFRNANTDSDTPRLSSEASLQFLKKIPKLFDDTLTPAEVQTLFYHAVTPGERTLEYDQVRHSILPAQWDAMRAIDQRIALIP